MSDKKKPKGFSCKICGGELPYNHKSDCSIKSLQAKLRRYERIAELKSPWISCEDKLYPEKGDFWVTWMLNGECEGIEWLSSAGEKGKFWNLNSGNICEVGNTDKQIQMFTHWMTPSWPKRSTER